MSQPIPTEAPEKAKQRLEHREPRSDSAQPFHREPHAVLQLQQTLGNQRVAQLIQAKRLTPEGKIINLESKLAVGAPGNEYEPEAGRIARQIVAMPDAAAAAPFHQTPKPELRTTGTHHVARDSKTPIPFPRVQHTTPTGTFYRRFDGVTTYSATPSGMLTKAGYQFARNDGSFDIWVKVDRSSEIWVRIPKPNKPETPGGGSSSGSPQPPKVPNTPDIQDARDWADDLEKRFNQLWDKAAKLKAMRNPDGSYPAGPFNDYFKKLERFDNDVQSVINDEVPLWRDSAVSAEEKKELEKHIARIKNVQEHPPEMDLE
ncbi:hypothetical protein [Nitrosovibrio tenuis]|uniref:Uncharacterized protein n=1 Tax=Nitrosovibrio tenuis TaxID=1233 RepID=A0A1H7MMF7_9PROT|nr:hypothetical protein [Nitrosovibrio tenuis]SEL12412.1 hypothetical protein SAMN05216387_105142 [Nitrosovibrio tenuis]